MTFPIMRPFLISPSVAAAVSGASAVMASETCTNGAMTARAKDTITVGKTSFDVGASGLGAFSPATCSP